MWLRSKGCRVDTISALPARTEQEIYYIISIAHNAPTLVQEACSRALQRARPADDAKTWKVIKDAQGSSVEAIREGAKERIESRERNKERIVRG